jgi:TolB-like protein
VRGSFVVGLVGLIAILANAMVASASSIEDAASKLADKIAAQLADVEEKPDVAVFPFSNSRGNITAEMGNLPTLLQGEIIHALTENSQDRFHVMNKATLARRLKGKQVSTREIDPSDRDSTASVLEKAGIRFAVLGSMDGVIGSELKNWDEIKINAAVFDDQGDVSQLTGSLWKDPTVVQHTAAGGLVPVSGRTQRLKVEILCGGQTLPMYQCRNVRSLYYGAFFITLSDEHQGKEYHVRVTNRGRPNLCSRDAEVQTTWISTYDPARLIGFGLVIDGVNSFFEPDAQGDYMPTTRAPEHCSRWILTPPGRILKADGGEERWQNDDLRINDGTLVKTRGTGHSSRTVHGFQATEGTAMAFVFGDSSDSLAEQIGIDKEIGLISIYVYPEIVPEERPDLKIMDPNMFGAAGTMTGRPLPSDVQGFQVNLVEEPRQIWRIYYRYKGEPLPVPKSDLVRFSP